MNSYAYSKCAFSLCRFEQSPYALFQELSGLVLKLPDSYVNILKEAGRVRRPFQSQAFALVMLCRFLADYFTHIENKASVTVDNVNSLEE